MNPPDIRYWRPFLLAGVVGGLIVLVAVIAGDIVNRPVGNPLVGVTLLVAIGSILTAIVAAFSIGETRRLTEPTWKANLRIVVTDLLPAVTTTGVYPRAGRWVCVENLGPSLARNVVIHLWELSLEPAGLDWDGIGRKELANSTVAHDLGERTRDFVIAGESAVRYGVVAWIIISNLPRNYPAFVVPLDSRPKFLKVAIRYAGMLPGTESVTYFLKGRVEDPPSNQAWVWELVD